MSVIADCPLKEAARFNLSQPDRSLTFHFLRQNTQCNRQLTSNLFLLAKQTCSCQNSVNREMLFLKDSQTSPACEERDICCNLRDPKHPHLQTVDKDRTSPEP